MYRNTVVPSHHANNVIGRNRCAASCNLRQHALGTWNDHAVITDGTMSLLKQGLIKVANLNLRFFNLVAIIELDKRVNHLLWRYFVLTNCSVQRCNVILVQLLSYLRHELWAHHLLQRQLIIAHALSESFTPAIQSLKTAFFCEMLTNLCSRSR